jgi:uncharacterized RmlC-like cupin family protein
MKKIGLLMLATTIAAGSFVAGFAVGGPSKKPTFKAFGEMTFEDMGGLKLATITGNPKKGPYVGLLQVPAGFKSPMHMHSGTYEAVEIKGTSSHWSVGEDGSAAPKMVPGSYWTVPAKAPHVSSCEKGEDCLILIWQKGKFDFTPLGDDGKKLPKTATGTASGTMTPTTTTTTTTTTTAPATTTTTTTKTPPPATTTPKKTP